MERVHSFNVIILLWCNSLNGLFQCFKFCGHIWLSAWELLPVMLMAPWAWVQGLEMELWIQSVFANQLSSFPLTFGGKMHTQKCSGAAQESFGGAQTCASHIQICALAHWALEVWGFCFCFFDKISNEFSSPFKWNFPKHTSQYPGNSFIHHSLKMMLKRRSYDFYENLI